MFTTNKQYMYKEYENIQTKPIESHILKKQTYNKIALIKLIFDYWQFKIMTAHGAKWFKFIWLEVIEAMTYVAAYETDRGIKTCSKRTTNQTTLKYTPIHLLI